MKEENENSNVIANDVKKSKEGNTVKEVSKKVEITDTEKNKVKTEKKPETKKETNPDIKAEIKKESQGTEEYKPIGKIKVKKEKTKIGFGKGVFVPFLSGLVGASLIVGTCAYVPQVKDFLFGKTESSPIQNEITTVISNNNTSSSEYIGTSVSVAEKILPSVVGIKVEFSVNSIFSFGTSTATAQGSGIIISNDGYILTNNHIVNSTSTSYYYEVSAANKVQVYLYNDETAYEGKIIGTDEQTDLAIIKIEKEGLIAAELGDSSSIKVGEFAMAVGNPLGMQSSVSVGVISGTEREITSDGKLFKVIQTDAAINSGNSGGALVNSKGQVIGLNTLKMSGTGIEGMGFAIPINSTKDISEQLIKYSKVKRPYAGFSGKDITDSLAEKYNLEKGIYITEIEEFSAAEKAGLKIGDIIFELDGKKITTINEFNEIKDTKQIGDEIKIKVYRNHTEKEITLTLQEK